MTALNETPLRRLGMNNGGTFRSLLEVMKGIMPNRRTLFVDGLTKKSKKNISIEKVRAWQLIEIDALQSAFDAMHKNVAERVTNNGLKNIKWHNKKTRIAAQSFCVAILF